MQTDIYTFEFMLTIYINPKTKILSSCLIYVVLINYLSFIEVGLLDYEQSSIT